MQRDWASKLLAGQVNKGSSNGFQGLGELSHWPVGVLSFCTSWVSGIGLLGKFVGNLGCSCKG